MLLRSLPRSATTFARSAEALEELAAEAPLSTLGRQRLRDVADAMRASDDAASAAVRWTRGRWRRWRRAPMDWPCRVDAPYCPHMPACRNVV